MNTRALFVTRVYEASLAADCGFSDFNAELADACLMLADEDLAGRAWCKREGYGGYTSYASLDDLPDRFPEFAELKALLDEQANAFARDLNWDMDGLHLQLDAIWVNILGEGGSHSGHIHPGSVISGTYYVAVPDGAGSLKLEDPRLALMMAAPQPVDDAPEAARRFVYLAPREGRALFWESWLRHEVMPNRSEDPRVSISFNYALMRD